MKTTIRDFQKGDRENYIRMSKEFFASDAVTQEVPESNFEKTFDACLHKSPYARGFMIYFKNDLAGYALLSFSWSNEEGGICVWLEEAYVLPEFQGKGLGKALLEFLQTEYEHTASRIRLEVSPDNEGAIRLYERYGYEMMDYCQMVKVLPGPIE